MDTLHEDRCTLILISRSVILRKRKISDKSCRKNKNPHLYSVNFQENRAALEIMWENVVVPDRQRTSV